MNVRSLIVAVLGLSAVFAFGAAQAAVKTIHSERSVYRNIFVTDDDDLRCLTFRRFVGGHRQTCINMTNPYELVFPYAKMMLGSLALNPHPKKVLIVGLGGGTLPTNLRGMAPDADITVVELDQAVVKVAKQFFKFETGPKLRVEVEDGRVFIKRALAKGERYDLIMLDAFEDDYIPEHLLTKEFLTEVKGVLTPDGVLAANTFSSSGLYPYESATYAAVFGQFYNLKMANRIIWAQPSKLTDLMTIHQNAETLADEFAKRGFSPAWLMDVPSTVRDWPENTRILTDQYSPSNLLNGK